MAEKMPKIRAYSLVKKEYGNGMSLAIDDESGISQIIGDVSLPKSHEPPCSCNTKESPAQTEARSKAKAAAEKAFAEMVLRHLNDGLAMETGRRRLERGRKSE